VQRNHECRIVVRYDKEGPREWPWSITHEDGQPVLTITDLDDSSLGIVLRALAQADGDVRTSNGSAELSRASLIGS